MELKKARSLIGLLVLSSFISLFNVFPSNAASVLAAWLITSDGVLKLRTASKAKLEAYFQRGQGNTGDRIWIDFPGELIKPRKLKGNGPIDEIRLGKPFKGNTRLVIEFNKSVSLNPYKLKLVGTSENLWKLDFVGLNKVGIKSIGEGSLSRSSKNSYISNVRSKTLSNKLNSENLPNIPNGKYKIIVDPGHGGPDLGAKGLNGLIETDIVLEISRQVSRLLREKGINVKLTRYRDIDVDLQQRVSIANRSNADAFISIHANASRGNRRDISGIETFFYRGYKGRTLASNIQKQLLMISEGSPNRGVRQSNFFVIRHTNMPAALVEVGFITGRLDARLLSQTSYRKKIAFAISKGIINYLRQVY
ncbi:N-acetylmuramoyl-L-alanine amidase family protein [Prochlorococcus marinus]|uniref:N-acetylmuramoyl-L-alanine amidase family protein n=1 Tax=Prochlorococcus marinus TaxID=1219 RepID=UPI0039B67584